MSSTSLEPGAAPVIQAPVGLAVGDYWTWTRLATDSTTYTYAIQDDTGSDWVVGTSDANLAFFDKRNDISTLGPVRKSDLAGSQGSDRVEFFRFPLEANKTWSTMWDQETKKITVVGVVEGTALMEARRDDGTLYATYTYHNATRYFGELAFYDANETVQFASKVTAHGSGYAEPLVSWEFETIEDTEGSLAGVTPGAITFEVPLTATDVWINVAFECSTGEATFGISPAPFVLAAAGQDDRGAGLDPTACPFEYAETGAIGAPEAPAAPPGATTETWGYEYSAAPQTVGTYSIEILVRTMTSATISG